MRALAGHHVRSPLIEVPMPSLRLSSVCLSLAAALAASGAQAGGPPPVHEPVGFLNFASPQVNPIVVAADGAEIYVANTTSGTVNILVPSPLRPARQVDVGVEPVSLALKPDGTELWVSNHVSDSISVIDLVKGSPSYRDVIETIQMLDAAFATQFDEPTGIAFASNAKAYVALSSRDQIAVIDTNTYQVTGFIPVRGSEPRAIAVRNGLLYALAFENGNKSEISACATPNGSNVIGGQCTLGLPQLQTFVTQPNLPLATKNIVIDPQVPDRDLFVYSTATDQEVAVVSGLGTLGYGLAVDANGRAFVTQTDARNQVNGNHLEVLATLQNRMFDNELAAVTCSGTSCGAPATPLNLEPGGTTHANSLATPYGIALSGDGSVALITAAGASRLASFSTALSGGPLAVLNVGAIPKGVALHSPSGATGTAYVLNSLDNTVSQVALGAGGSLSLLATVAVGRDSTPPAVRRGAIAFNDAFASTSGNFSCGSCHPDANVDQLLWRIGGECSAIGCPAGDEPRTTMPVRGLKNTVPLHWDGTLGDPFGGGNGSVGFAGAGGTDCALGDADGDHDCFLDLVNASLSGVMCDQSGSCPPGGNELSAQEKDDLATFLASVSYPPARSRRIGDRLSRLADPTPATQGGVAVSALKGFADFFINQDGGVQPRSCADADGGCHALPLGATTNSATLNGFDAPTLRGLTDRTLQFSIGITNAEEILTFGTAGNEPGFVWDPNVGFREQATFGAAFLVFDAVYGVRPQHIFEMTEEASTGTSGATGRQLTLNTATATSQQTLDLMNALEAADGRGAVNLRGSGSRNNQSIVLSFIAGSYTNGTVTLTPAQLRAEAAVGTTFLTLTAHLRQNSGSAPQPLLATAAAPNTSSAIGDPPLPAFTASTTNPPALTLAGTTVSATAWILVDGAPVTGTLTCVAGSTGGMCNAGNVSVDLTANPGTGLHMLQVQNPMGLTSNEIPLCVGTATDCQTAQ
jgi:YVTN family beta-propeller protein